MSFRISQLDPIPELPDIRVIKTIGQGAFAVVKSAYQIKNPKHIFAIKYIHRFNCRKAGLSDDQIGGEALIHKKCSGHPNIVNVFYTDAHRIWLYIIMEMATGGDLFDKIEPDVGLDEDLSHFYFKQLISAVDYIHSKGVAHRDIKPENILIDDRGNLKITDFGLACVFKRQNGSKRLCNSACGSPPYVAPELASIESGYDPEFADIWSCGIVLFVIATGQMPWEEPTIRDPDFKEFIQKNGRVFSEGWNRLPLGLLSFLRFMLKVDPTLRPDMSKIRQHVWVNRSNSFSTDDGLVRDTVALTARLLGRLHIGLSDEQFEADSQAQYDSRQDFFTTSQPLNDFAAMINDDDDDIMKGFSATQQVFTEHNRYQLDEKISSERQTIIDIVSKDPASLQFSKNKQVDLTSLDISLTGRFTRFFSVLPIETLMPILVSSLERMGVPTDDLSNMHATESSLSRKTLRIGVFTTDRTKMPMKGQINISRVQNLNLKQVEFSRTKGNPVEWRRFFKRFTVLSREAVYIDE